MLHGFVWRSTGGGDDVPGLMEVGAEQRRFPALDCLLELFGQRESLVLFFDVNVFFTSASLV
jgi:hypothetical protein